MKPIIGVMPLWDKKKDSLWMLPGYLDGVSEAGGIPVIFPFSADEQELGQLIDMCDGFLFTGGHDISPETYGEEPLEGLIDDCLKRDAMETIVLRYAIDADKPVLSICRGIQFINAALGGSLYQDLPTQRPSDISHRQKPPYDEPSHEVTLVADSPLCRCLEADRISVNSCHHQAVKKLARGLEPMALSTDGLTEALYMPGKRFLWAVQWHPEFSFRKDENSMKIFRAFVGALGGARACPASAKETDYV
ncbi:MAG: gamma-glutamyl-gamma-aminobutyrate hydrolase family protein [Oscillospiraceae bacterium]|nr:gamma-glutamyl-gamma-aminobutyrate hydrolase family protein [Oscillospiraceae bacterium]